MSTLGAPLSKLATGHSWTPGDGFTFLPVWEGIPESANGIARALRRAGIPYVYEPDGPWVRIRCSQPTEDGQVEKPKGNWVLTANDITVDIFDEIAFWNFTEAEMAKLRDLKNGEIKTLPSASGLSDEALGFYTLIFNGQTSVARVAWILRHSLTVSQAWTQELVGSNLDCIYTTAQLLAECAEFDDPLPALYIANINKIPVETVPTGYRWGWIKKGFSTQSAVDDKVETSVEYHLDGWPNLLYDFVP